MKLFDVFGFGRRREEIEHERETTRLQRQRDMVEGRTTLYAAEVAEVIMRIESATRLRVAQMQSDAAIAHAAITGESNLWTARLAARRQVIEAMHTTLEAESALRFRYASTTLPTSEAMTMVQAQQEMEQALLGIEVVRQQRLAIAHAGLPAVVPDANAVVPARTPSLTAPSLASQEPGLTPFISDNDIDRLAIKAVTRYAQLPPAEADVAFAAWRAETERRYPPAVAGEIINRADALRGIAEQ